MDGVPLISVIIPVYNAEDYLWQCLDSITSQAESEWCELILVDDGSADASPAMCAEFAARYARTVIIRKNNGGASDARNAGIRRACGEYLLFIDADDYILPGSLKEIARRLNSGDGGDIVLLNAGRLLKDGSVKPWAYPYKREMIKGRSRADVLEYMRRLSRYPVSPCIKLLRRDFVIEKNILFTTGIVCEDVDHMITALLSAETFDRFDLPYYCARYRTEGSVMTSGIARRFESTRFIIRKWLEHAKSGPDEKRALLGMLAVQYLYLVAMYNSIAPEAKAESRREVKSLAWLLRHGGNRRVFIPARIVLRLCGLRLSAALFSALLI